MSSCLSDATYRGQTAAFICCAASVIYIISYSPAPFLRGLFSYTPRIGSAISSRYVGVRQKGEHTMKSF